MEKTQTRSGRHTYRGFALARDDQRQFVATGSHGIFGWFATRPLAERAIDSYLDHPFLGAARRVSQTDANWDDCPRCSPLACDCTDAERPQAVPAEYTPLRNRGCYCGADFDGRDCMCFE